MQQHGSQAKAIFLVAGQPKVGVQPMRCLHAEGCGGCELARADLTCAASTIVAFTKSRNLGSFLVKASH
jgi:hypothetical protein